MVTTWIWQLGIPGSRQFWLITEVVAVLGHDLGYWNILEHHCHKMRDLKIFEVSLNI